MLKVVVSYVLNVISKFMVNNFEEIKKYLIFKSADDFYILFIKKRRKDNPGLEHGEIEISTFYITSIIELERLMPLISSICNATNSRAYINLNSRSFRSTALHTNKKLGEILLSGDYKYARKIYESESNSHTNTDDKKWIIDFDCYQLKILYVGDAFRALFWPIYCWFKLVPYSIYQLTNTLSLNINAMPLL